MYNNYASVEGTVVMYDDKIAWPINYTTIECDRNIIYCRVGSVSLGKLLGTRLSDIDIIRSNDM